MRRFILGSAVLLTTALLAPGTGLGAKQVGSCPAVASGFAQVDRQTWWDRTVAGVETEGIPVYDEAGDYTEAFEAFAQDLGFADAEALFFFVWVTQWAEMDKNDDGYVCMKDRPRTPGNPAYFFTGVDNTAAAL